MTEFGRGLIYGIVIGLAWIAFVFLSVTIQLKWRSVVEQIRYE
jgi:hypothetical protein